MRLLLATLLLCGCASAPRQPFTPAKPPADQATIYFYRPSEMTGRLIKPTLSADKAELVKLPNDSYFAAALPPGSVKLRSLWPGIPGTRRDDSIPLALEAGKTYYVRVRYHTGKPQHLLPKGALQFEDRPGLETVDETEAVPQMQGLTLVSAQGGQ